MHSDVVRIAYAPGEYAVRWRHAYPAMSYPHRQWINALIVRSHRLAVPGSLDMPGGRLARCLVQSWDVLGRVAMLMGAARLRCHVLAHRSSVLLPPTVHAFMRQGHAEADASVVPATLPATPDVLTSWGGMELQLAAPLLPPWLAERMPLLFDRRPIVDVGASRVLQGRHWDAPLFWSALRHAQTLS